MENSSKILEFSIDFGGERGYNNLCREETAIWRCRVAGRARTIGNRVYLKRVSRVRISPSPPSFVDKRVVVKNPALRCGIFAHKFIKCG